MFLNIFFLNILRPHRGHRGPWRLATAFTLFLCDAVFRVQKAVLVIILLGHHVFNSEPGNRRQRSYTLCSLCIMTFKWHCKKNTCDLVLKTQQCTCVFGLPTDLHGNNSKPPTFLFLIYLEYKAEFRF